MVVFSFISFLVSFSLPEDLVFSVLKQSTIINSSLSNQLGQIHFVTSLLTLLSIYVWLHYSLLDYKWHM